MAYMAQTIREVMTANPTTLPRNASVFEAARVMRDSDIGDVVVIDKGQMCGIFTDRDVVIRVLAAGRDPTTTKLADICTQALTTVAPTDSLDQAVQCMRQQAIRRLPVVENGRVVGIVSLGDLARERDPLSALSDISVASPNR